MNRTILTIIEELEQSGRDHDAKEADQSRKFLILERTTAELIRMLILCSQRKFVLEIGTSNGYSAIYLASTLREIQGSPLITIEKNPSKAEAAKQNFERANLADFIDLRIGSATDIIRELSGPFDCVFFDADRISAPEQLQLLLPKLTNDVSSANRQRAVASAGSGRVHQSVRPTAGLLNLDHRDRKRSTYRPSLQNFRRISASRSSGFPINARAWTANEFALSSPAAAALLPRRSSGAVMTTC